ncbi:hypothetical protein PENANT_c030G05360 [Penicillium antarcticum]|uniref:Uncharacterized protein n=1 Tax=Penicillium antarcticum TaxID=416450 RepID=A0A1V6PW81_9EURO|nr:hypothetical protein PENANT_c030G05360 [Penicillium antarcticum]
MRSFGLAPTSGPQTQPEGLLPSLLAQRRVGDLLHGGFHASCSPNCTRRSPCPAGPRTGLNIVSDPSFIFRTHQSSFTAVEPLSADTLARHLAVRKDAYGCTQEDLGACAS